jgi:hypothetical protein
MQSQVELEELDPSYNEYVVAESTALATTLDQYWLERRALCEQIVERHSIAAGNTKAEQEWLSFCSSGTLPQQVSGEGNGLDRLSPSPALAVQLCDGPRSEKGLRERSVG